MHAPIKPYRPIFKMSGFTMTKTCPNCHATVLSTSQPMVILNRKRSDDLLRECGYEPKASTPVDAIACVQCGAIVKLPALAATPAVGGDGQLIDWLNAQIVSEIYLDDGRLIDVRGNDIRAAIRAVADLPAAPPASQAAVGGEALRETISNAIMKIVSNRDDRGYTHFIEISDSIFGGLAAPPAQPAVGGEALNVDMSPSVKRARDFFWQKADEYDHEKLQAIYNDMHELQDRVETIPLSQALAAMDLALQIIDRLTPAPAPPASTSRGREKAIRASVLSLREALPDAEGIKWWCDSFLLAFASPPEQPAAAQTFYGAECPSYPACTGGCGLGCTKEIEYDRHQATAGETHMMGLIDHPLTPLIVAWLEAVNDRVAYGTVSAEWAE